MAGLLGNRLHDSVSATATISIAAITLLRSDTVDWQVPPTVALVRDASALLTRLMMIVTETLKDEAVLLVVYFRGIRTSLLLIDHEALKCAADLKVLRVLHCDLEHVPSLVLQMLLCLLRTSSVFPVEL